MFSKTWAKEMLQHPPFNSDLAARSFDPSGLLMECMRGGRNRSLNMTSRFSSMFAFSCRCLKFLLHS